MRAALNETMLLGADTIRPVLNRLLPDIDVVARPRFSSLTYVGSKKATRLPRRSAVVGFSASEVYAIAELIRRQRGGTAVVMGAMSPRTRNAQVDMFQSGEVDYLVATDAIGMGLNMDVNHVWFASLRKYDGRSSRPLRTRRAGADRRARRAPHERRHVRHDRRRQRARSRRGRGDRESSLRSAARPAVAQQRARLPLGADADRLVERRSAARRAPARARAGRSARSADSGRALDVFAAAAFAHSASSFCGRSARSPTSARR